jgi:hypothetical protein
MPSVQGSHAAYLRKRFAQDEVAIIEALHRRMLEDRWYYAQSHALPRHRD